VVLPLSFFDIDSGPEMNNPGVKESVLEIVRAAAGDMGYGVYEAHVLLKGENSKILVRIDHLNGISLDDCEAFSRELSRRLDGERILPNYALEISSPGVNRQIRSAGEYARFKGSPVKVIYRGEEMQTVYKGIIGEVGETGVELHTEGKRITLDFDRIKSANLEL
jgi:ribosome maturation factor RimP